MTRQTDSPTLIVTPKTFCLCWCLLVIATLVVRLLLDLFNTFNTETETQPLSIAYPPNYFPTRVPAEIRNIIYASLMTSVKRPGEEDRSWNGYIQHDDYIYQSCLGLCGANRQLRFEFGKLLTNKTTLHLDLDELNHFVTILYERQCIKGRCLHSDHSTRPRRVKVFVTVYDIGKVVRGLTNLVTAKAWVRDLNLEFIVSTEFGDYGSQHPAKELIEFLNAALHCPPVGLLDDVQSGLIKSIALKKQSKRVHYEPAHYRWIFGVRATHGYLEKEAISALALDCERLCLGRSGRSTTVTIRVQDVKGKVVETYLYHEASIGLA